MHCCMMHSGRPGIELKTVEVGCFSLFEGAWVIPLPSGLGRGARRRIVLANLVFCAHDVLTVPGAISPCALFPTPSSA
jgi:hypothetical protein